ncbi:arsenate reductase/protein-tyrosine-phosphatase family protein [Celeribacter litoreus]|uniref:arsenate reductase/protein-tyrosine-phosphatase family protein n=1 Tax=Celeribacter litoreus TaxID=2876714 RepID=UPI001CCD78F4|nr:ArsR family transcriptional regulator [Celeribacter litoreus]MCA0042897.1 helix-turn-helix domain-containing protein [Celeribacter litoreus]
MELNKFDSDIATTAFAALGHPGRLSVFRLLMRFAPRPVRPSEIADALGLKPNTLSGYLADLNAAGLISASRDGRSLYYKVELRTAEGLVGYLVNDCCRGRPEVCAPLAARGDGPTRPYRVLFLCSGNSARSIIAEALLRDLGGEKFIAASAGTRPAGELNARARSLLEREGHDTLGLWSKDIDQVKALHPNGFDFVFTVCDTAAQEDCATWAGPAFSAHWGLPDPVAVEGSESEKALAFAKTYDGLRRRIETLTALPVDQLDRLAVQTEIDTLSTI